MILDKRSAAELARTYHQGLSEKLGMGGAVPYVDVRNIDEKSEDVRKKLPGMRDKMSSEYENLCDAFRLQKADTSGSYALTAFGILTSHAAYDSENNRINITLYPSVNSVLKFYSNLGFSLGKNSDSVVEGSSTLLPEKIAECVGYSLRANAMGYAGAASSGEKLIVAEAPGFFGERVSFRYDRIEKPGCRDFLKKNNYRLVGAVNAVGFFAPVGVFECSDLFTGTKNAFKPSEAYRISKDEEKSIREGKQGFLTSKRKSQEEADRIAKIQAGLPAKSLTAWYNDHPEAIKEVVYNFRDPLLKWPARKMVATFMFRDFNDIDAKMEAF